MFKHRAILVFIFLAFTFPTSTVLGQTNTTIPNERTYVHTNTTLLFPGDYLYYKCYVQRLDNKKLSDLSKVVYVELINEEKEVVFNHKLFLENGLAFGDFFLNQSLSSGNYKLIAYTQWMKNLGTPFFFQQDISIINPYTNDQKSILKIESELDSTTHAINQNKTKKSELIKLSMTNTDYGIRHKVSVPIEVLTKDAINGSYSISIKPMPLNISAKNISATDFYQLFNSAPIKASLQNAQFLPELRGELLSGQIIDNKDSIPVKDTFVALSAVGQETLYDVAASNEEGSFYFNIGQPYEQESIMLRPLENENYRVHLNEKGKNNYNNVEFYKLKIDSTLKKVILDRSIHNQIENAYSSVKPDSIVFTIPNLFFDKEHMITYNLDDYTRFSAFKQTIQEVVLETGVKRLEGTDFYHVKTPENVLFNDKSPVILLDGFLIDDHSDLNKLDAREIKTIRVFTSNLVHSGKNYKGAMLIETEDRKNANAIITYSDDKRGKLFVPQKEKKYYAPNYSGIHTKNNTIPDFRYQLLWDPNITFTSKNGEIEFFTSDISGNFKISLEGFTQSGIPISVSQMFSVRQ